MHARIALSQADRAACLTLRREVFIDEQGVSEADELDDEDDRCLHVLVVDDHGTAIGTARLNRKEPGIGKVQRVAVTRALRGHGVGRAVMAFVEQEAKRRGDHTLVLGAQHTAIPFYERLGYTAYGPSYDDAGIPHRDMKKRM